MVMVIMFSMWLFVVMSDLFGVLGFVVVVWMRWMFLMDVVFFRFLIG